jgi:hypothetical protein
MDDLQEYLNEAEQVIPKVVIASCPTSTECISTAESVHIPAIETVFTVQSLSQRIKSFSLFRKIFLWVLGVVCFRKTLAIAGMLRGCDVEYHTKLSAYGVEFSGKVKVTGHK